MELVKNIFFNTDKLVGNTKVKISYTGKFFQDNSEEVYLHYGFGLQWDNLSDIKMEKTDSGYQAEIELCEMETLNLCFKNEKNEWDNNEGQNYIFPIEKIETALVLADEKTNIGAPRRLRKSYLWGKKIRIALYKIITYLPKTIMGNFKRKITN